MRKRGLTLLFLFMWAAVLAAPRFACAGPPTACECCHTDLEGCPCGETPFQGPSPATDSDGSQCLSAPATPPATTTQASTAASPQAPAAVLPGAADLDQPQPSAPVAACGLPAERIVSHLPLAARAPPTL